MADLRARLSSLGSHLLVRQGLPEAVIPQLAQQLSCSLVRRQFTLRGEGLAFPADSGALHRLTSRHTPLLRPTALRWECTWQGAARSCWCAGAQAGQCPEGTGSSECAPSSAGKCPWRRHPAATRLAQQPACSLVGIHSACCSGGAAGGSPVVRSPQSVTHVVWEQARAHKRHVSFSSIHGRTARAPSST